MCRVQNQSKVGTALCTFFLFNLYQFVILHKISSFNLAIWILRSRARNDKIQVQTRKYRKKEKQKAGGNKQTKTQN